MMITIIPLPINQTCCCGSKYNFYIVDATKAMVETENFVQDDSNYITINENNPIWRCRNAMTIQHDCLHAICNDCYSNNESMPKRVRRDRDKKSEDDNDDKRCNHVSLERYADGSYYTETYMAKVIVEDYSLPRRCIMCKRNFFKTTQTLIDAQRKVDAIIARTV